MPSRRSRMSTIRAPACRTTLVRLSWKMRYTAAARARSSPGTSIEVEAEHPRCFAPAAQANPLISLTSLKECRRAA